jgi:hypothetical protein
MALTDAEVHEITARLAHGTDALTVRQAAAAIVAVLAVEPGRWVERAPLYNLARGLMVHTPDDARAATSLILDALAARGVVEGQRGRGGELWRVPGRGTGESSAP